MNNVEISFIVPCYNVEKYIAECVNSILRQTVENIEIILINDGSVDNTLNVIKELAASDDRIIVIDKINEGVSKARNVGVSKANGEYIVFVDGDDYISELYSEYMLGLIQKWNTEFALSKYCFTSRKEKQVKSDLVELYTPANTAALLLSPVVKVGCWNKIYRRDFLQKNNILFNTNLFYGEGLSFILTVAQLCSGCAVGEEKHYYYRRDNPDSACTVFDIQKVYNGEESLRRIKDAFIIHDEHMDDMLLLHTCMYNAGAITKIRINHVVNQFKKDDRRWRKFNRENLKKIFACNSVSLYRKLLIFASCFFPNTLSLLEILRRKQIMNKSVV